MKQHLKKWALCFLFFLGGSTPAFSQCNECLYISPCFLCVPSEGSTACRLIGGSCPQICVHDPCIIESSAGSNGQPATLNRCALPAFGTVQSSIINAVAKPITTGVALRVVIQQNDPATLVSTQHSKEKLFNGGEILNEGPKNIIAYRLGAAMVSSNGVSILLGKWMDAPSKRTRIAVPAKALALRNKPSSGGIIIFFVSDLRYSDKSQWSVALSSTTPAHLTKTDIRNSFQPAPRPLRFASPSP